MNFNILTEILKFKQMNSSLAPSIMVPKFQNCQKCSNSCYETHIIFNDTWFYCSVCQIYTKWNHQTKLQKSKLNSSLIEKLLLLFLSNKTPSEALDSIKFSLPQETIHITTVRRCFLIFCNIVLDYYEN